MILVTLDWKIHFYFNEIGTDHAQKHIDDKEWKRDVVVEGKHRRENYFELSELRHHLHKQLVL